MNWADKHTMVIIDDHPLCRYGISQLISTEPALHLVGETSSGKEGIDLVRKMQPNLLLLDLKLKDVDGLKLIDIIRQQNNNIRIVILSACDNEEDKVNALKLGADNYLVKDNEPGVILDRILKTARGQCDINNKSAQNYSEVTSPQNSPSPVNHARLTPREMDILRFIARGFSNKHIGNELDITENTVKVHVKNLLKKLKLRSRVEAAVWATRHAIP